MYLFNCEVKKERDKIRKTHNYYIIINKFYYIFCFLHKNLKTDKNKGKEYVVCIIN